MSITSTPSAQRRGRLLASCGLAAMAAVTLHAPAHGQANNGFIGVPTVDPARAEVTTTPTNGTLVTVKAPKAIINWRPTDRSTASTPERIVFLGSGGRADFVNSADRAGQDFVVLNRILPDVSGQKVLMDGIVNSTLSSRVGGAPGGQLWFYTPNGLLIGNNSVFNVGSLLLTTNDVTDADFLDDTNRSFRFSRSDSAGSIEIESNAQLNALASNAYVALIAPRVRQSGKVSVDGTANYVAAEDVDISISGSLFDIQVTTGSGVSGSTRDDAALVHEGTTTLLQNETGYGGGFGSARNAVMVAIPKNDAITMLVSGNITYQPATTVSAVGSRIILSGGYNYTDGSVDGGNRVGSGKADILVTNGTFGPQVDMDATGAATVRATAGRDVSFGDDLEINSNGFGGSSAFIEAVGGGTVRVADYVYMDASGNDSVAAGVARVTTSGSGAIEIGGGLDLFAETYASFGSAADAINTGVAEVLANGGTISVGDDLTLFASGYGGRGTERGGNAAGGTARVATSGTGSISVGGGLYMEASGYAASGQQSGSGTGGTAGISAAGGSVRIGSSADIYAEGVGESGYGSGGIGGSGIGGTGFADAAGGSIEFGGGLFVGAGGYGGRSQAGTGGAAQGGTARATASGAGTITVGGNAEFFATAEADEGPGRGGDAIGGTALVSTSGTGSVSIAENLFLDTSAFGGLGAQGGSGTGGTATVGTAGGAVEVGGSLDIYAKGFARFGDSRIQTGGTAAGGTAQITGTGGNVALGFGTISADAIAGRSAAGAGVAAQGGTVRVALTNGTTASVGADLRLSSTGEGGESFGGTGGTGRGGLAEVTLTGSNLSMGGELNVLSGGMGGRGAIGGSGIGGDARMNIAGGTLTISEGRLELLSLGIGGNGFGFETEIVAGVGRGGTATITVGSGGRVQATEIFVRADGRGGELGFFSCGFSCGGGETELAASVTPSNNGAGGDGIGGSALFSVASGQVVSSGVVVSADGVGSDGGSFFDSIPGGGGNGGNGFGGAGGDGSGGTAGISGSGGQITFGNLLVQARGMGGSGAEGAEGSAQYAGGAGGLGEGGTIELIADRGAIRVGDIIGEFNADGFGGSGGDGGRSSEAGYGVFGGTSGAGGSGVGGAIAVTARAGGAIELPAAGFRAIGRGGAGGLSGAGAAGAIGGAGTGGQINVTLTGGTLRSISTETFEVEGGGTFTQVFGPSFDVGGFGGRGGDGGDMFASGSNGGAGGAGGTGVGGGIDFNADDSALTLGSVEMFSGAAGGQGGSGGFGAQGGDGGSGGTAIAGTLGVTLLGTTTLDSSSGSIDLSVSTIGGSGGRGGTGTSRGATSGSGGNAVAGSMTVDLSADNITISELRLSAEGSGGSGGSGFGEAGYGELLPSGGNGGIGRGGAITLTSSAGIATLGTGVTLNSSGTGGDGGEAFEGNGASGGAAFGGAATISASGTGSITAPSVSIISTAVGGFGANGASGATGSRGGNGGSATGGVARATTSGQGAIVVTGESESGLHLTANAFGGSGGSGGDGSDVGDTGGPGGNGGGAVAGDAIIDIQGGSIETSELVMRSNARGGGFGGGGTGAGGDTTSPTFAADGSSGAGAGRTITILVRDGSLGEAGALTAGSADLRSIGTIGGSEIDGSGTTGFIRIADTTRDPAGSVEFGDLEIQSLGGGSGLGIDISSEAGPIKVLGSAFIFSDLGIGFTGVGTGNFSVDGALTIVSGDAVSLVRGGSSSAPVNTVEGGSLTIEAPSVTGGAGTAFGATDTDLFITANVIDIAGANAVRDLVLDASAGTVAATSLTAGNAIRVFGTDISIGSAATTGFAGPSELNGISLTSSGALTVGSVVSATSISLVGIGISAQDLQAGTFINVFDSFFSEAEGERFISIGRAEAGQGIELFTSGDIAADELIAGTDIVAQSEGGAIRIGSARAGRDILLGAQGLLTLGSLQAGDDINARSETGAIVATNLVTTGTGEDTSHSETGYGSGPGDGSNIVLTAATSLDIADANAADVLRLAANSGAISSTGTLRASSLEATASTNFALTDLVITDGISLSATNGFISGRSFSTSGDINLAAAGNVSLDSGSGGGDVRLTSSNAAVTGTGTVTAGRDFVISAATGVNFGTASAGRDLNVRADGSVSMIGARAGDDIRIASNGTSVSVGSLITTGTIDSEGDLSNALIDIAGNITVGTADVSNQLLLTSSVGTVTGGDWTARRILVNANSGLTLGSANATESISIGAGSASIQSFTAGQTAQITTTRGLSVGTGSAGQAVILRSTSGAVSATALSSNGRIQVSGIDLTIGTARATTGDVFLVGSGNVSVEEARAGDDVTVSAGGTARVAAAFAQGGGTDGEGNGFNIRISAPGDITLGSAETIGNLQINSFQGGLLRIGEGRTLAAGRNLSITVARDLALAGATAGLDLNLGSSGAISADSLAAGGNLIVDAGTAATIGTATAGRDMILFGSTVALADGSAGRDLRIEASGAITIGRGRAGDDIDATSETGAIIATDLAATGFGQDSESGYGAGAGSNIQLIAATGIDVANAVAAFGLVLDAGSGAITSTGTLRAAQLDASAGTNFALTDVDINNGIDLVATNGFITGRTFSTAFDINLQASGNITLANATAGDDFTASAGGAFAADRVQAGTRTGSSGDVSDILVSGVSGVRLNSAFAPNDIRLTSSAGAVTGSGMSSVGRDLVISSGAGVNFGDADAGRDITVSAGGSVILGSLRVGDDLRVSSNGTSVRVLGVTTRAAADSEADGSNAVIAINGAITVGDANVAGALRLNSANSSVSGTGPWFARSIEASAADRVSLQNAAATNLLDLRAGGELSGGTLSGGTVELRGGSIAVTSATSRQALNAAATGSVAFTEANAGTSATITGSSVAIGGARVGDTLRVTASSGAVTGTFLQAGNLIEISGGDITIGTANSGFGDVSIRGTGNVGVDLARAGDDVRIQAGGTARVFSASAQGGGTDTDANGFNIDIFATGDVSLGSAQTVGDLSISSVEGGLIRLGTSQSLTAGRDLVVDVGRDLVLAGATAGRTLILASDQAITADALTAGQNVSVRAAGAAAVGTAGAGGDLILNAGSLTLGTGTAGRDVRIVADGAIGIGTARAGDDINVNSRTGSITAGTLTTTGLGQDLGESGPDGSNIVLAGSGDTRLDNGTAVGAIRLASAEGSVLSAGLLRAASLTTSQAGDIALTDLIVAEGIELLTDTGSIIGNSFISSGNIGLGAAEGDVTVASLEGRDISANGRNVRIGSATAAGSLALLAPEVVSLGTGEAERLMELQGGTVSIGSARTLSGSETSEDVSGIRIFAAGAVEAEQLDSASDILVQAGSAQGGTWSASGSASLLASGDAAIGSISGVNGILTEANALQLGSATSSAGDVVLRAAGALSIDEARAGDDLLIEAGDTASVGAAFAVGGGADGEGDGFNISISSVGDLSLGSAETVGDLRLTSSEGGLLRLGSARSLAAGRSLVIEVADDLALADATAAADIILLSNGAISAATLTATNIELSAGTSIAAATATATETLRLHAGTGAVTSTGTLTARTLDALAGTDFALNDVFVTNGISLDTANGSISGNRFETGGAIDLDASGDIRLAAAVAGADLRAVAGGIARIESARAGANLIVTGARGISLGAADAVGDLLLTSSEGGLERLGSAGGLSAGRNLGVSTASNLALASATAGGSIALMSRGAVTADTANAGGSIGVAAGTGASLGTAVAATDIIMSGATVGLANGTAGRDILLTASGAVTVGQARAGDDFEARAGGAFAGGTVTTTGAGQDGGSGQRSAGIVAAAIRPGSNILVDAVGDISLASGNAHGATELNAGGAITSATNLTAGTDIVGSAGQAIAINTATAGGLISFTSRAGAISAASMQAGSGLALRAAGNVAVTNGRSGGDLTVDASGATSMTGAFARNVAINSTGGVSLATVDASGTVSLRAAEGAVRVSQDLRAGGGVDAAGRSVDLRSAGALAVRSATASAGNVALASGGNLDIAGATASGAVSAESGGVLGIGGTVNGSQISLSSRDIAVGPSAKIGTATGTSTIQITANGGNVPVVIGGSAGSGSGYRLDGSEFAAFAARDISIGTAGTTGSLLVESLSVRGAGAGNPNLGGRLTLQSGGNIEVTGKVAIEGATEANSLRILSGGDVFVNAETGSISLTGSGGTLAGSLDISGRSVVVASRTAATELSSLATTAERSTRLGRSDGVSDFFIGAGSIQLSAAERIYVQNSSASSALPSSRTGLAAGPGGITLRSLGSSPAELIINGVQLGGASPLTGAALLPVLRLGSDEGSANFAVGSTVNSCLLAGGSCGGPVPVEPGRDILGFLEEAEEDEENETDANGAPLVLRTNSLISFEGYPYTPMIDEPVSGAGNEDLWTSPPVGGASRP